MLLCETLWGPESLAPGGGGGWLARAGTRVLVERPIERQHTVCSLRVKHVCCSLNSSSSSMMYSVALMCETAVDLHAKEGGGGTGCLNRVQHPDRQCSRPQENVLEGHAINHSCNTAINRRSAGWGGFQGGGNLAMRIGGGGDMGVQGGGGELFFECEHNLLRFGSILCMVLMSVQAIPL